METATQEPQQYVPQQPQKEHEWLWRLVGEWTMEAEAFGGPGQPLVKSTGKESCAAFGGFWVVCDGEAEMGRSRMTLGYDPQKGKYVGSWIGTMMSNMWVYEGEVDASGRTLALNTQGPDFSNPGRIANFQDIITFMSDDHRTLTSRLQGEDGNWVEFMTAHYRRT